MNLSSYKPHSYLDKSNDQEPDIQPLPRLCSKVEGELVSSVTLI